MIYLSIYIYIFYDSKRFPFHILFLFTSSKLIKFTGEYKKCFAITKRLRITTKFLPILRSKNFFYILTNILLSNADNNHF